MLCNVKICLSIWNSSLLPKLCKYNEHQVYCSTVKIREFKTVILRTFFSVSFFSKGTSYDEQGREMTRSADEKSENRLLCFTVVAFPAR